MTPNQLGGLLDSSVLGVPTLALVVVGGLLALAGGAILRVKVEGVRRSASRLGRSDDRTRDRGSSDSDGIRRTDREGQVIDEPAATRDVVEPDAPGRESIEPAGPARDGRAPADPGRAVDGPVHEEPIDELPDLLQTAVSRYADEAYDGSIQAAYMFVRKRLAAEFDVSTTGTHWDFFERCVEADLVDGEDALRELTEVYEQATFGSRPATRSEAERAMELSGELTGVTVNGAL